MKNINVSELRTMKDQEGLILQGCGGDPQEWVDGVNKMLTEEGILLDGAKFDADKVVSFQNENLTNLLFPFTDDVKLNMGKLAMCDLDTQSVPRICCRLCGQPSRRICRCQAGTATHTER